MLYAQMKQMEDTCNDPLGTSIDGSGSPANLSGTPVNGSSTPSNVPGKPDNASGTSANDGTPSGTPANASATGYPAPNVSLHYDSVDRQYDMCRHGIDACIMQDIFKAFKLIKKL